MSEVTRHRLLIWNDLLLACVSGLLVSLSFPSANFEFLAWVAFLPLFSVLENKSRARSFLLSYLAGVAFWALTIYWLVHVTLVGTILLVLYLALYSGVFGMIVSRLLGKRGFIILAPALWVLLEYGRSHLLTGFPWALLGYSQYRRPVMIQTADLAGPWSVSFLVMMVNAAAYVVVRSRVCRSGWPEAARRLGLGIVVLSAAAGYGVFSLRQLEPVSARLTVCVVPGNIPQELKWRPSARTFIVDKYISLTRAAAQGRPDLMVWPEAALPVIAQEEPQYLARVAEAVRAMRIPLVLGAVSEYDGRYFNSALLIGKNGSLVSQYHKLHLVPFGEYIPLRRFLPFLETIAPIGDIERGTDHTLFAVPGHTGAGRQEDARFAVLICFEDVFPELARAFVQRGARVLINITNDAWYKMTPAAMQHFQASVFRAVENRTWVVRSANTGVSGFISPAGVITQTVRDRQGRQIFVEGYAVQDLAVPDRRLSIYTRWGDWFVLACAALFIVFSVRKGAAAHV